MKIVNPIGRDMRSGLEGNSAMAPKACKCSIDGAFSTARTSGDHCFHCGCQCNTETVNDGNSGSAFWTLRASPEL